MTNWSTSRAPLITIFVLHQLISTYLEIKQNSITLHKQTSNTRAHTRANTIAAHWLLRMQHGRYVQIPFHSAQGAGSFPRDDQMRLLASKFLKHVRNCSTKAHPLDRRTDIHTVRERDLPKLLGDVWILQTRGCRSSVPA